MVPADHARGIARDDACLLLAFFFHLARNSPFLVQSYLLVLAFRTSLFWLFFARKIAELLLHGYDKLSRVLAFAKTWQMP
jgi:hypothetical protein